MLEPSVLDIYSVMYTYSNTPQCFGSGFCWVLSNTFDRHKQLPYLEMFSVRAMVVLVIASLFGSISLQGCGGGGEGGGGGGDNTIPTLAGKTADLSTLVTALKAASLIDTLSAKGPFTVFAPDNTAFGKLPSALLAYLLHDKAALTQVLEYHVASGSVLSSALGNGDKLETLEGDDVNVTITKKDNKTTVMINEANVKTADVMATNGVVHIISQVLIPSAFSVPTIPAVATAAGLKTLVAAVGAAQLGKVLSGAGPFTVFAPTDDAFKALPEGVLDRLLLPANIKDLQKVLNITSSPVNIPLQLSRMVSKSRLFKGRK